MVYGITLSRMSQWVRRSFFAVVIGSCIGAPVHSSAAPRVPFDPGCPRLLQSAAPLKEWQRIEAEWEEILRAPPEGGRVVPWEDVLYDHIRSRNTRARLVQRYSMIMPTSQIGRLPWRRLSDAEYKDSEVYFADGLVWDAGGLLVNTDHGSIAGFADFTMDDQGRVRIWKNSVPGDVHHPSLGTVPGYWSGVRLPLVAAAGAIRIKNGRILAISDKSGHYMPPRAMLAQFLDRLWLGGIPWRDARGNFLIEIVHYSAESYSSEEGRYYLRQGIPVLIGDL